MTTKSFRQVELADLDKLYDRERQQAVVYTGYRTAVGTEATLMGLDSPLVFEILSGEDNDTRLRLECVPPELKNWTWTSDGAPFDQLQFETLTPEETVNLLAGLGLPVTVRRVQVLFGDYSEILESIDNEYDATFYVNSRKIAQAGQVLVRFDVEPALATDDVVWPQPLFERGTTVWHCQYNVKGEDAWNDGDNAGRRSTLWCVQVVDTTWRSVRQRVAKARLETLQSEAEAWQDFWQSRSFYRRKMLEMLQYLPETCEVTATDAVNGQFLVLQCRKELFSKPCEESSFRYDSGGQTELRRFLKEKCLERNQRERIMLTD